MPVTKSKLISPETAKALTSQHCTLARASARLTLEELADASGVHFNTISRFENGDSVRPSTRTKIAEGIARTAGIDCLARVMGF